MGAMGAMGFVRLRIRKRRRSGPTAWLAKGGIKDEMCSAVATTAQAATEDSAAMEVDATEMAQQPVVQESAPPTACTPSNEPLKSDDLISALAAVYASLIAASEEPKSPQLVIRFHAIRAPGMTIPNYLTRLFSYFKCSDACLLTSLVYIDRVLKLHAQFKVSDLSIHRLLAVTLVLSAKFNDDTYYSNSYYAKVCGLTLKELNVLEATFFSLVNWKLQVTTEEYEEYQSRMLTAFQATSSGAGVAAFS
jgi:hypothetical protein